MNAMAKYLFAILFIGFISCKNDPKTEAQSEELKNEIAQYDALMEEAIEVHDEVMPKMGQLMELREIIKKKSVQDTTIVEFKFAVEQLNDAHDGMMEWMREYNEQFLYGEESPSTQEALDKKLPQLEQKVTEIKDLKTETNNIITYSQKLLRKAAVDEFEKN